MTEGELGGLKLTLKVLHLLAKFGVLKQVVGDDGLVRWKATKGHEKRLAKS